MSRMLEHAIRKAEVGHRLVTSERTISVAGGGENWVYQYVGLWEVTGTVQLLALWGEVTATGASLGSISFGFCADDNWIDLTFRPITGGGNIAGSHPPTTFFKGDDVSGDALVLDADTCAVSEGSGSDRIFAPIILSAVSGATNFIYCLNNTLATESGGKLRLGCLWLPCSKGSGLREIWVTGTGLESEWPPS